MSNKQAPKQLTIKKIRCANDEIGDTTLFGCYGGAIVRRYMLTAFDGGDAVWTAIREESEPAPNMPGFVRSAFYRWDTGERVYKRNAA